MKKIYNILAIVMISLIMVSCSTVPAGNVGVKFFLLGGDKGVDHEVLQPGRYWIGINEQLFKFPTFTQNYVWTAGEAEGSDNNESLTFQTKEGLTVNADVGITYHLEEHKVPLIFETYKRGINEVTDVFLRNMVRDALVTSASTREVETVYGAGKAALINEVEKNVREQTDSLGIIIDKIYLIGTMRLPPTVVAAIDSKIKATQDAQKRENEVQMSIAQAQKDVEEARGDSLSSVIRAAGQAEANKKLNASLTPNLIKYEEIQMYKQKWNGQVSQVNGSGGVLLNLGK